MSRRALLFTKVLVHLLCWLPFAFALESYRSGTLATKADPVEWITHFTGHWALWLLLADLAITPVRRLASSLSWLVRLRRLVGLYAFFYATLHLLTYVFLFSGYDVPTAWAGLRAGHSAELWRQLALIWPTMLDDLRKRRFIQVGLASWFMLLLLAVTSPQRVLRWMGGRPWMWLHRLIYLAAIAAVAHLWWQTKAGEHRPWLDLTILAVLLAARLIGSAQKRRTLPNVTAGRAG